MLQGKLEGMENVIEIWLQWRYPFPMGEKFSSGHIGGNRSRGIVKGVGGGLYILCRSWHSLIYHPSKIFHGLYNIQCLYNSTVPFSVLDLQRMCQPCALLAFTTIRIICILRIVASLCCRACTVRVCLACGLCLQFWRGFFSVALLSHCVPFAICAFVLSLFLFRAPLLFCPLKALNDLQTTLYI